MTVRELLGRIDSRELSEWMAYYEIEPFGEERADLRSGIIASVMANAWRGKNSKRFSPGDFMPFKKKVKQTWQDMRTILEALAFKGKQQDGNRRITPGKPGGKDGEL